MCHLWQNNTNHIINDCKNCSYCELCTRYLAAVNFKYSSLKYRYIPHTLPGCRTASCYDQWEFSTDLVFWSRPLLHVTFISRECETLYIFPLFFSKKRGKKIVKLQYESVVLYVISIKGLLHQAHSEEQLSFNVPE